MQENDTIAAIATSLGNGALGLLRLSGPRAIEIASPFLTLKRGGLLSELPSRTSSVGLFHQNGRRIDHVMVTLFRNPQSYTGEDVVEISCHGGAAVLKAVLELLQKGGARMAEPGEFSRRAFLNGKLDLAQAEAVADLIAAQTETARAAAFAQLEGRLSQEIRGLRDGLLEMLAHLEVDLDHSDDTAVGATFPPETLAAKIGEGLASVERLIRSYDYGRTLREGVTIAIVGRPNAGKSSLLNSLLKSERAIVTPLPGTTRDTVEASFDLLGLSATLIDTAGLRDAASDPVEKIGMERTRRAMERADLVLFVLDAHEPLAREDKMIAAALPHGKSVLLALNKSDLPSKISEADTAGLMGGAAPSVRVSALKNSGIETLISRLRRLASPRAPEANAKESEAVVTSLRHRNRLLACREGLLRARALTGKADMMECLALEVREALDALGEIIGAVASEDLLREIFSKFCIGK